ncbi:hypothetical protein Sjap_018000 [Stephania japonica]|uniref:Uncharacterized protein n=1 Tax=Stephania japonica TaxID=461633 RepID=A0AAP0I782_9MAGN
MSLHTWMAPSKKPVTWEETGNMLELCGGHRGRRPQTVSYRKSKESACVMYASDVDEVHDETSAVNASATIGREIELHKSQVTTAETSSSYSIEEQQDESQEQEADGEDKTGDVERWQDHVLLARSRGNRATYACEAAPEYIPWFPKISHPTIENPEYCVGGNLNGDDLLDCLRRTVDIVLKWRSLPPGEADMAFAIKMADDVHMHLTGKGVASSATTTSGGNELARKSKYDIHATQSQFHTNENESGSSKHRKHGKLQHKKKWSKTNE